MRPSQYPEKRVPFFVNFVGEVAEYAKFSGQDYRRFPEQDEHFQSN